MEKNSFLVSFTAVSVSCGDDIISAKDVMLVQAFNLFAQNNK